MNRMIKKRRYIGFKRALGLSLAFAMAVQTTVLADVTIPPNGAAAGTGQAGQTPGNQNSQNGETQAAGTQTGGAQTPGGSLSALPTVSAAVTTAKTEGASGGSGTSAGSTAQGTGSVAKPVVQAQGAVLYDATHNQFLFEQNADTRFYPASITKIMTALLVAENLSLNDTVTFSSAAVTNLESGAVTLNVKAGDKISVKDCLHGLLLKSANEIANGLAEKVSGSVSAFAALMNQKAASLGCTNTNFVNPNGLNNSNHYTTARDMALIAKAAFANPIVCQVESTMNYDFPATASVPTVRKLSMSHKMLNPSNTAYYYPGVVGGKTGYTSLAGNTLVTCVERDGVRLIAVVLKSRQSHYQDTKALLDYGFELQKSGNTTAGAAGAAGPGGGTTADTSASGPGMGAGTGAPGGTQTPAANGNTWVQDAGGWRFVKADGSYAKNECMIINNEYYYFADNQYMVNGWNLVDGVWRFFRPSGGMAYSRWIETGGMWYYVDATGSLFTNGTTPDGFVVDGNGVWVQ